jgi:hypothetical protein
MCVQCCGNDMITTKLLLAKSMVSTSGVWFQWPPNVRSTGEVSIGLYYIVASCCTFHSITISSPSCVQTLVSSSHSHIKFSKLLKFSKVLKNSTCLGQYGHPQVLKFLVGKTTATACVPSMRTYIVLGVLLPVVFSCLVCVC